MPRWFELWWSDYQVYMEGKGTHSEADLRRMALPRLLITPALRALLILRMANHSPRFTWHLWRNLFIHLYSIDWSGPLEIGPRFQIPHPVGLMLLDGSTVGTDVGFAHNVTLAGDADKGRPVIEDRVIVYPNVVIMGAVTIGQDSIVGANSVVTRDVPPNSLVTPRGVLPREASRKIPTEQTEA